MKVTLNDLEVIEICVDQYEDQIGGGSEQPQTPIQLKKLKRLAGRIRAQIKKCEHPRHRIDRDIMGAESCRDCGEKFVKTQN